MRNILAYFLPKFLKNKIKNFYWKESGNYQSIKVLGTKEKYIQLFNEAKLYTSLSVDNFISKNNFSP